MDFRDTFSQLIEDKLYQSNIIYDVLKGDNPWCSTYTEITDMQAPTLNAPSTVCGDSVEFSFSPPLATAPACTDVSWIYSIET